jgi:hypothetical protein
MRVQLPSPPLTKISSRTPNYCWKKLFLVHYLLAVRQTLGGNWMSKEKKLCRRCGEEKTTNFFYRKRTENRYGPYCKDCTRKQAMLRQRTLKLECVKYKGGKCEICGYDKCVYALEFHHSNPEKKEFNISRIKSTIFSIRIKTELDKCTMLCSNCHREEHYGDAESYESLTLVSDIYDVERGKGRKTYFCVDCNTRISGAKATRCRKCHLKTTEVITWPSVEEIRKLLKTNSYRGVGRILGVSDNAIKKRLKSHK